MNEQNTTTNKSDSYLNFLDEFPKTGPDTVAGKMLRHYWHPLCLSEDIRDVPFPVRMLSEDLVAFRTPDGKVGLVGSVCPHRLALLEWGQVRPEGLQCSYHGWTFDQKGYCKLMPLEPADTTLKEQVRQLWYPVQEWAGVVWCYMGEEREHPPELPKIDIMTRTDGELVLERGDVRPHNYLAFAENFADMGHGLILHGFYPGKVPPEIAAYVDMTVARDMSQITHYNTETAYGMKSVMVHDTEDPNKKFVNTWAMAFPCYFRFGGIAAGLHPDYTDDRRESGVMLRIIDDHNFEIIRYTLVRPGNFQVTFTDRVNHKARGLSEGLVGTVEPKSYDTRKYKGWEGRPPVEDYVIQESQGVIPPRHLETLGTSDSGVALLRRLWRRQIDNVARGKTPMKPLVNEAGVIETDTFKGFARPEEIHLRPENMPDSRDGRGLIRHDDGRLVFDYLAENNGIPEPS